MTHKVFAHQMKPWSFAKTFQIKWRHHAPRALVLADRCLANRAPPLPIVLERENSPNQGQVGAQLPSLIITNCSLLAMTSLVDPAVVLPKRHEGRACGEDAAAVVGSKFRARHNARGMVALTLIL